MLFQNILLLGFIISVYSHCRHGYLKQKWEGVKWRCPQSWVLFKRSCYYYSVDQYPVPWDVAQEFCFLEGAQLVEIESAAEQTFLVNLKQTFSYIASIPAWIGLHDKENDGTHIWVSTGKVANYTNWGTAQPKDNKLEDCVQITNTGLWNEMNCAKGLLYFCERPVKAVCQPGWTFFRGSCYSYEDTKYTRNYAEIACKTDDSHLVEITSAGENAFLLNLMRSMKARAVYGCAAYEDAAWIGLDDRQITGTNVWNSSGKVANYTNWGTYQSNYVSGLACVYIDLFGRWYDIPCSFTLDYICERPADDIEACEEGWSFFNRRCYKYSDTTESWESSLNVCRAGGAALVDITSAAENAFLVTLRKLSTDSAYTDIYPDATPLDAWIGLNVVNGTYIWDPSGNTTSYTNWEIGQPDNDQSLENCVEMNEGGKWNDNSCTKYRMYFCEKSSTVIAN